MKKDIALLDYVGSKAGMDYYNIELLKALQNKGHRTFLFSNEYFSVGNGLKTAKCFASRTPSNGIGKITDYFGGVIRAGLIIKMKRIKKVIFHFFSATFKEYFAIRYLKSLGLEIYLIVHDVSAFAHQDKQKIKEFIFFNSDQLIVHNQYSKGEVEKVFNKNNKGKIKVIKHGSFINLSLKYRKDKQTSRYQLGLHPDKKYLLFFGQIKRVKGLDILINAMPYVNEFVHLIIAGRPWKDDFAKYQEIIDKKELNRRIMQLIMYIPDNLRHSLFKGTDALVVPYKEIYQSGVLIMGMSYGLPVIASDIKGNRESINNGENGILFKSEDHMDLAEKINTLFNEEHRIKSISDKSMKTMEKFNSWDNIAEEYQAIF